MRSTVRRTAKSPVPIIAGVAAGLVLLIVIIAAAASGGSRKKSKPAEKPVSNAAPSRQERAAEDTGYIMFVCSGSDKHEDREEIIKTCAACNQTSTFFADSARGAYVCYKCKQPFDNDAVRCSICGKVAVKSHLKHR